MTDIGKMCDVNLGQRSERIGGSRTLPGFLYTVQDICDMYPWKCCVYFPWKHPQNMVLNCLAITGDGLMVLKFEVLSEDQYRVAEVRNKGGFFLTAEHNIVHDRVLTRHELCLFLEDSMRYNLERHGRLYTPVYTGEK